MNQQARKSRIGKEVEQLTKSPPPGVVFWPKMEATEEDTTTTSENTSIFLARLNGPENSPFKDGVFELEIRLGQGYPFEPPMFRFVTKIFHPNIDESGRICLDSLKLPPSGSWRPSLNISQILSQLLILLVEPGLGDPLMKDIADLYKNDYERYEEIAKDWTKLHATLDSSKKRFKSMDKQENSQEHEEKL